MDKKNQGGSEMYINDVKVEILKLDTKSKSTWNLNPVCIVLLSI